MTVKPALTWRQRLGAHFEHASLRFLESQGLSLLTSNYRCKFGEIDLIMHDRSMLVFVEVRYRRSASHGTAAATVDSRKQARIRFTARHFLCNHPEFRKYSCRFDVVAFEMQTSGNSAINWIPNAFY